MKRFVLLLLGAALLSLLFWIHPYAGLSASLLLFSLLLVRGGKRNS